MLCLGKGARGGLGAVNDVVVDKSGGVDHLDHGAETNGAGARVIK